MPPHSSKCSRCPGAGVASFEKRIKKVRGKDGYIHLLWKGWLLTEHEPRGEDLGIGN